MPSVHHEPIDEWHSIFSSLDGYAPYKYEKFMNAPFMVVLADYEYKLTRSLEQERELKKRKK